MTLFFLIRIKHHLRTAIDVFIKVIEYESNNLKKLLFEGKITKFIKDQAKVICKKLISFGLKRYMNINKIIKS